MQTQEAQPLTINPPVLDENGKEVPAFTRYERGRYTVLCNQTGCKARVSGLHSPQGDVWLEVQTCIDLEDYARPSAIEMSGVNQRLVPNKETGLVAFTIHEKGTRPVGKRPDTQSARQARQNGFDVALDARLDREEREEKSSRREAQRRTGEEGTIAQETPSI